MRIIKPMHRTYSVCVCWVLCIFVFSAFRISFCFDTAISLWHCSVYHITFTIAIFLCIICFLFHCIWMALYVCMCVCKEKNIYFVLDCIGCSIIIVSAIILSSKISIDVFVCVFVREKLQNNRTVKKDK